MSKQGVLLRVYLDELNQVENVANRERLSLHTEVLRRNCEIDEANQIENSSCYRLNIVGW